MTIHPHNGPPPGGAAAREQHRKAPGRGQATQGGERRPAPDGHVGADARRAVPLRALVAGPPAGSPLKPVLPKTTKVLGVTTRGGVGRANFSAEIKSLNVGSRGEALAVAAIANTLIKFPDIERVQILIDGSRTETLAGHVDISQPLAQNDTVVMLPTGGQAGQTAQTGR